MQNESQSEAIKLCLKISGKEKLLSNVFLALIGHFHVVFSLFSYQDSHFNSTSLIFIAETFKNIPI